MNIEFSNGDDKIWGGGGEETLEKKKNPQKIE